MAKSPSPAGAPSDTSRPAVQRGGLWGLLCSALGLLILWYGIPLSIAGVVLGVRARRRARAESATAPGWIASIVVGVLGIAMWLAAMAGYLLAYDAVNEWQSCLASANTNAVAAECDHQFTTYLEQRDVPEVVIRNLLG